MNPLKQKQYNLLKEIGCQDLADKVQEIVKELNKASQKEKTPTIDEVAEAVFESDTLFDAKEIMFDYVSRIAK